MPQHTFPITPELAGQTLAAALRKHLSGQSWSQVRRLVETRRVRIDGELCTDPARRVHEGEVVTVADQPAKPLPRAEAITLRHVDDQIIVVEKPSGISTVRHPAERDWPARRREQSPTLEELVWKRLNQLEKFPKPPLPRLRIVHRLDKHTSGLLVFARTVAAERALGLQFKAHTVHRKYLAIVVGRVHRQRVVTRLVRDRGDGRRGSTPVPDQGKIAITDIDVVEELPGYTVISCRLETGRTHQIRIHLAELGHPICGEMVYNRRLDGTVIEDQCGAPRLALHAAELGLEHPTTGEQLRWTMALPRDLASFAEKLRTAKRGL